MNRCVRNLMIGITIASWAGCGWLTGTNSRPPEVENDIARDVTLVGSPMYRLVVTNHARNDLSRLIVLYVHVDSKASEPFELDPEQITLVHDDGTVGVALERDQTAALLERNDLEIVQADPAVRDPSYDRLPEVQEAVRKMIVDELLEDTEVRNDQPARGYLLFDLRREQSTLDAITLQLPLTRLTDGARLRQSYRFSQVGGAGADTHAASSP